MLFSYIWILLSKVETPNLERTYKKYVSTNEWSRRDKQLKMSFSKSYVWDKILLIFSSKLSVYKITIVKRIDKLWSHWNWFASYGKPFSYRGRSNHAFIQSPVYGVSNVWWTHRSCQCCQNDILEQIRRKNTIQTSKYILVQTSWKADTKPTSITCRCK